MKDILGRTTRAAMPLWMQEQSTHPHHGCGREDCDFGIRLKPTVVVGLGLYITEAILHGRFDAINYCDCRWGQLAQQRAALTWEKIQAGTEYVAESAITSIEMQLYGDDDGPTIEYVPLSNGTEKQEAW